MEVGRVAQTALGIAAILFATVDAHAQAACADVHVRVHEQTLDARWREALSAACADLARRTDLDRATTLDLTIEGESLLVTARAADGRRAIRRVQTPASLASVLEALLVILPAHAAAPAAAPAEPIAEAPPTPTPATPTPPDGAPDVDAGASAPRPGDAESLGPHVELGAAVDARVAGPYLSAGPLLAATIQFDRWLFVFDGRWDVDQRKTSGAASGFEMQSFAAGIGIGRRVPLGALDLDLGLLPRLVVETQTVEVGTSESSRSGSDLRVAPLVRASWGRTRVRFVTTLDGELSTSRIGRDVRFSASLPTLPAWSAGFAAGISWRGP